MLPKSHNDKFLFYPPWSAIFSCDRDGRPQICAVSISHLGREGFAAALFLSLLQQRGAARARDFMLVTLGVNGGRFPSSIAFNIRGCHLLIVTLAPLSLLLWAAQRAEQTSLTTRCISERLRLTPCKQAALLLVLFLRRAAAAI